VLTRAMSASFLRLTLLASLLVGAPLAACAGKATSDPGDDGGGDGGASSGTCATLCANALKASCAQEHAFGVCETSCLQQQTMAVNGGCGTQYAAYLDCCAQPSATTCQQDQVVCCEPQSMAVFNCLSPPPECQSIPKPRASALTCSRSAVPDGGTTTSCSDGSGNTWTASCGDGNCACDYDGKTVCGCFSGSSIPCCPGTL
jgi:hypothetical protein